MQQPSFSSIHSVAIYLYFCFQNRGKSNLKIEARSQIPHTILSTGNIRKAYKICKNHRVHFHFKMR